MQYCRISLRNCMLIDICSIVYECIIFFATLWKAWEHHQANLNTPILAVLYRDGAYLSPHLWVSSVADLRVVYPTIQDSSTSLLFVVSRSLLIQIYRGG